MLVVKCFFSFFVHFFFFRVYFVYDNIINIIYNICRVPREVRPHVLRRISRQLQTSTLYDDGLSTIPPNITSTNYRPSLYVINAAGLSKPQTVEQLSVDLNTYNIDIAAITETHLKQKHNDSVVSIAGYTLFRRDRLKRRGGGVAVYMHAHLCKYHVDLFCR